MDNQYMQRALELARAQLGRVAPNPAVGCVLVKNGQIVAEAATAPTGRPHGEFLALQQAGELAVGATAYVTLEPCAHEGATPSCARLLAEAGIRRVVMALPDPDPRTSGAGAAYMRQVGMEVEVGLCQDQALKLNQGFFTKVIEGRPMVTLKMATSEDGCLAWSDEQIVAGKGPWITSPEARLHSHYLRASHDAILVGIETVLSDDPMLSCRMEGAEDRSPIRIVLDRNNRLPSACKLAQTADRIPTWVIHQGNIRDQDRLAHINYVACENIFDVKSLLSRLADHGITRLMVEGGARVLNSFLTAGLFDQLHWYQAPLVIGQGGLSILGGRAKDDFIKQMRLSFVEKQKIGNDKLEIFEKTG